MPTERYLLALNFAEDGALPDWWPLIPAGRFGGRDGRAWLNDKPEAVLTAIHREGRQVPLDENHATEVAGPKGKPAPARGFFTEFANRGGTIYGKVALNTIGQALLAGREYKYYSPAFPYDPDTGRVLGLSSVALTNKHNLDLPALNQQRHHQQEETPMDYKAIATALGLNTEATETQIITAINTLKNQHQTALNAAQPPDPEKFVPVETHRLALGRAEKAEATLATNQQKARETEGLSLVEQGIKAGKIAPANKDHFLALCRDERGLETVKQLVATAPKVLVEDTGTDGDPAQQTTALNTEEQQVATLLGLTAEDMTEAKAAHTQTGVAP